MQCVLLLAFMLLGCGNGGSDGPDAGPDATWLGRDCQAGQPCGEYSCADGVCTTLCATSSDCRSGTECRDLGGGTLACVAKTWSTDIGKSCVLGGAADCPMGFTCQQVRPDDPGSYCTTVCTDDRGCPPTYLCADPGDGMRRCLERIICSPCGLDEQCRGGIPEGKCLADATGPRVCAKSCTTLGKECPVAFECMDGRCVHHTGSCFGEGKTCDPCTANADCAGRPGSVCIESYFSAERYCSEPCVDGTCPAPYVCRTTLGQCTPPDPPEGEPLTCVGLN